MELIRTEKIEFFDEIGPDGKPANTYRRWQKASRVDWYVWNNKEHDPEWAWRYIPDAETQQKMNAAAALTENPDTQISKPSFIGEVMNENVKCSRCRNTHKKSERCLVPDKKRAGLKNSTCPSCGCRYYTENKAKNGNL